MQNILSIFHFSIESILMITNIFIYEWCQ